MSEKNGLEELSRPVRAVGATSRSVVGQRQGLRVALLSLAAAILLLGAAIAAVFCYRVLGGDSPAAAASNSHHVASIAAG